MASKKVYIWAISLVLLVVAAALMIGPILLASGMSKVILSKQRAVLYDLNHVALAKVVRSFSWPETGQTAYQKFGEKIFENQDSAIPDALWIANPARIVVQEDRIDFEYGGALLHFGISIFPEGKVGEGTHPLGKGVWFYSDDGKYPKKF